MYKNILLIRYLRLFYLSIQYKEYGVKHNYLLNFG